MNKNVEHPVYYNMSRFETIDEMIELFGREDVITFCRLNAYKYKARAPFKGNMKEDFQKADWYIAKANELRINEKGYW